MRLPVPTAAPALPLSSCSAVLRDQTSVDAVEMFDRASLRECESNEDMVRLVPDIKGGCPACLPAWDGLDSLLA
jgi:hypothetical protein